MVMSADVQATMRSSEETSPLAPAFIDGLNSHDLSAWYALLAGGFTANYLGGPALDRDGARQFNQVFLDAFPDLHFAVERTLVDGAHIVVQWRATGTFTAPFATPDGGTIAPNGKTATVNGVFVTEVADGRIAREWSYWDRVSLFTQLGLMPA